jgi:hypothetical protein
MGKGTQSAGCEDLVFGLVFFRQAGESRQTIQAEFLTQFIHLVISAGKSVSFHSAPGVSR